MLQQLVRWLQARGHSAVVTTEDQLAPEGTQIVPEQSLADHCDLVVVLGGDGTMLRAARLVADAGRPVLGVNLGQLGFLTGFAPEDTEVALAEAIDGTLGVSERMRLAATFHRSGSAPVVRTATNDAVIHQGAMARLVELDVHVDGERVSSYRADGLIVASPTGSTAYNMAAGGPIIIPGHSAMTITPICAHSLTNRPLVVPPQATVQITLGADTRGVVLTVDGQWAHSFLPGDVVTVTAAARPLRLFTPKKSYFDILRDKLQWGMRSDRGAH